MRPPDKYEEVALLNSDSRGTLSVTGQGKMNTAIHRLKKEAAKLGANGIILNGVGNEYGGSVGVSSGMARAHAVPGGAVAYGSGTSFSAPVLHKSAAGIAIWVQGNP